MENLVIRHEQEADHHTVEVVTREAFWNLHVPGCDEHYLVHMMRTSPDFIPELTFVAELDGQVVGSIFFAKSYIIDVDGTKHDTLIFGPISVSPDLQGRGIGSALIEQAKKAATEAGHRAILIYGDPGYYKRFGFRHAKAFGISNPEGKFPVAHLALELYEGALRGITGKAYEGAIYEVDKQAAAAYDTHFEPKVKAVTASQADFQVISTAYLT